MELPAPYPGRVLGEAYLSTRTRVKVLYLLIVAVQVVGCALTFLWDFTVLGPFYQGAATLVLMVLWAYSKGQMTAMRTALDVFAADRRSQQQERDRAFTQREAGVRSTSPVDDDEEPSWADWCTTPGVSKDF